MHRLFALHLAAITDKGCWSEAWRRAVAAHDHSVLRCAAGKQRTEWHGGDKWQVSCTEIQTVTGTRG